MLSQGYLIDSLVCIAALWLFYIVVLHRRTNLRAARWFLLTFVPVGLLLPLVRIPLLPAPSVTPIDTEVFYLVEEVAPETIAEVPAADPIMPVVGWLYLIGVVIVGTILGTGVVRAWIEAKRASRRNPNRVIYTPKSPGAYSAFGVIFLNPKYEGSPMVGQIIAHEQSHIAHRHTLDIVWMGVWRTLLWFHPAVWHATKLLREVHEFQADRDVIRQGHPVAPYVELLIGTEAGIYPGTAQAFCYSLTKKRLQMIAQATRRTSLGGYVRLAALIPVTGILLGAFSLTVRAAEPQPVPDPLPAPVAADSLQKPVYTIRIVDGKMLSPQASIYVDGRSLDENRSVQSQVPVYVDGQRIDQETPTIPETKQTETKVSVYKGIYKPLNTQNLNATESSVETPSAQSTPKIEVRGKAAGDSTKQPIYVVDGVIYTSKEFQKKNISPEDYQSVMILKGKAATEKYGEQGRNGAIIITTKKAKFTTDLPQSTSQSQYFQLNESTSLSQFGGINRQLDSLKVMQIAPKRQKNIFRGPGAFSDSSSDIRQWHVKRYPVKTTSLRQNALPVYTVISMRYTKEDQKQGITVEQKLLQEYPEILKLSEDGKLEATRQVYISILEEI